MRTVRILDRGRERRGGELAARSLVVFLPSIESKGCITAMIELPRARSCSVRPHICVWDRYARALQMPSAKAGRNQATDRGFPVLGRRGSRFHATSCCVLLGSIDGRGFNGKVAQTLVPEPLDSTTKSPQKWRMRSRIPVIPTPVPWD